MVAAQLQMNHPSFFSIVSFHMCIFHWTSCLSPPGNFLGIKSQCYIRLSRVSTCPSSLSDSWAAEHPEIQDRSTAHWGGELYSMSNESQNCQTCCAYAVQMICICTVCPARSKGIRPTLHAQNVYMVQVYVFLLGK